MERLELAEVGGLLARSSMPRQPRALHSSILAHPLLQPNPLRRYRSQKDSPFDRRRRRPVPTAHRLLPLLAACRRLPPLPLMPLLLPSDPSLDLAKRHPHHLRRPSQQMQQAAQMREDEHCARLGLRRLLRGRLQHQL